MRATNFIMQHVQEMKLVIPNAQRINRGGMVLTELVDTCRSHDFTDIVVLHEHRGEPGACTLRSYGGYVHACHFMGVRCGWEWGVVWSGKGGFAPGARYA